MSELFITLPPPRVASESTLTLALAVAVAIYTVPIVNAAREPDTLFLVDDIVITHCFPGNEPDEPLGDPFLEIEDAGPSNDRRLHEPRLTRAMAVEQAVDYLARFTPRRELTLQPEYSIDHGEIMLVDNHGYDRPMWKLRELPQLAPSMRPPTRPRPVVAFTAQGALPRASIARVVKRSQQALAACDDTQPSLDLATRERHVAFTTTFMVDAEGHVASQVVITGSDDPITSCVKRVVSTTGFPRSEGNTQINLSQRYGTTSTSADVFVR